MIFQCKLCSFIQEYEDAPLSCPECGSKSYTLRFGHSLGKKKWVTEKERWSRSMGCPPSQVEEFRKRFPNSTYNDDGLLLVKNRKDKLRQMKERDMVEWGANEHPWRD